MKNKKPKNMSFEWFSHNFQPGFVKTDSEIGKMH